MSGPRCTFWLNSFVCLQSCVWEVDSDPRIVLYSHPHPFCPVASGAPLFCLMNPKACLALRTKRPPDPCGTIPRVPTASEQYPMTLAPTGSPFNGLHLPWPLSLHNCVCRYRTKTVSPRTSDTRKVCSCRQNSPISTEAFS